MCEVGQRRCLHPSILFRPVCSRECHGFHTLNTYKHCGSAVTKWKTNRRQVFLRHAYHHYHERLIVLTGVPLDLNRLGTFVMTMKILKNLIPCCSTVRKHFDPECTIEFVPSRDGWIQWNGQPASSYTNALPSWQTVDNLWYSIQHLQFIGGLVDLNKSAVITNYYVIWTVNYKRLCYRSVIICQQSILTHQTCILWSASDLKRMNRAKTFCSIKGKTQLCVCIST